MDIGWAELLLTLLVGMGPLKGMLVFVEETKDYDAKMRDKVALIGVATAVSSALTLLILGASLQALLHFSIGALSLSGGLILLLFSVRLVIGTTDDDETEEQDPIDLAVSPIGLPLILNPVGIVALVTFSAEAADPAALTKVAVAIIVMGVIDVLVLLAAGRIGSRIPHPMISLLEKLFSILVAALAVEIMVDGARALEIF
jgi:multiple antibiotic resistance protein